MLTLKNIIRSSFFLIIVRIVLVTLYAYVVAVLVRSTLPDNVLFTPPIPKWILAILYPAIFNMNTEINFAFNRYLNKKLPWFYFPKKRLLIQSGLILGSSLLIIGSFFTTWYFINGGSLVYPPFSVIVFISSVVLLIVFVGISVAIDSLKKWKTTLLEVERLEKEKLKSDYKALQNQVNPHFLFNSLNVLISEIKHDPNIAETFTRKLSLVYRYVLQSKNYNLILLNKEIDFIRSYIYLHQVRVDNALKVSIDVNDEALQLYLPPLTLQILVENAIKHNVMNKENPLHITIENLNKEAIAVKNNLNPKQSFESTQTGLSNIKARYELLKQDGFKIEKSETEFIVTVPLLNE